MPRPAGRARRPGRRTGPPAPAPLSLRRSPPRRWTESAAAGRDTSAAALTAAEPLGEVAPHLVQRDPLLRHRVALPHRHRVVGRGCRSRRSRRTACRSRPGGGSGGRSRRRRRSRRSSAGAAVRPGRAPSGDRSALRDSGSTATLTGASRRSSRSTVRFSSTPLAFGASSSVYASSRNASIGRSTPAAGSITYGTQRSPFSWSKYDRSTPECLACVVRSKSVRFAMPSSSPHSVPAKRNRYSMSTVRFE